MSLYSRINERIVEIKVADKLKSLGYIIDFQNPNCDVFTQKPKYQEEKIKLKGKCPDFIIYDNDVPIAIIETKKPHSNLLQAEKQATDYANNLGVNLVFSYDGYRLFSKHLKFNSELFYGNTPITDFIDKNLLRQYINTPKIDLNFGKVICTEQQFIK